MLEEFANLPLSIKRQVLQERYEQFFSQAWNWFMDAETLRRQAIPISQKQHQQSKVDISIHNASVNLDCMRITRQLISEYASDEQEKKEVSPQYILESLVENIRLADLNGKD